MNFALYKCFYSILLNVGGGGWVVGGCTSKKLFLIM